jgi:hypothetical protein
MCADFQALGVTGDRRAGRFLYAAYPASRRLWCRDNPFAFVVSANIHRRHLTTAQKGELIEGLLGAKPEQTDRAIAKVAMADHKTVAAKIRMVQGRQRLSPARLQRFVENILARTKR